ncbi:ribosomal protein L2 [Striga asiatica]|uniref:Ribosomal protein L2 n=1 Tax=Striga asiatica TaxID=4170 RepID=A0A5A7QUE9_STRAF|nr:ribosomal protein L2 [Striga asiatica]
MAATVVVGLPTRMPPWSKSPFTRLGAGSKKTCAKPAFFAPRMRERGKNTFSLCEVRKWRTHSILWAHRIKRKAALSWQSFRRQETDGLVGAAEHNESKPKTDQGFYSKPIGEGPKDGACKVDRAPVVGALKWNFDRMRVSNPAAEMSSGFLGLDEWPATFYVRRAKGPGHSRMNQCE